MSALIDELVRRPALLEREVSKEIARRVAAFDARSREIEAKLDTIESMFDAKAERMAENGYGIALARQRRAEKLA
jgi:hypothetical protein